MTVQAAYGQPARLPAYALYGAVLSGAGLPIYIYAPKFFAETYGVSLAALGAVLFGLRLFDVVQDPVLGWISERLRGLRAAAMALAALLLAVSMLGLFAATPPVGPLLWFGLTITGLFTAFSFLSINFYARGVTKAAHLPGGHVQLAAWRESGALLGVCLAAIAPTLLMGLTDTPFGVFALGFAVVTALAAILMAPEWGKDIHHDPTPISAILSDPLARRLLLLALVNATPVAVSSTLFLFFVQSRLGAPGWEGPLLVLFFLSAALSAPLWSRLAQTFGTRRVLLSAMGLAIASFGGTLLLGPGDAPAFGLICILSGATIGADLTLLPAAFARRMAAISPRGGQGFGLWSLVNKFTLAFAAVALLPLLDRAGFQAGAISQPDAALTLLTVLYAGVPSLLKLVAIALLLATRLEDTP